MRTPTYKQDASRRSPSLTSYDYEIYLPSGDASLDESPVTTKYVFSSAFSAINKGRSLKKEYGAVKVRIQNYDNFKVYWVE